jgi:peptidoglycan/xylan/chitin deacetylase (PgdA/CDA1 family)
VTTIKNSFRFIAAAVGSRLPATRFLSPRHPVILVYHGVPRKGPGLSGEIFERQLRFLEQRFELVSWEQLGVERSLLAKVRVVLTFDDGFRNNAEVVAPILRRHNIPAVFFLCSRHAEQGRYLWFSYLRALERWFKGHGFPFRGQYFKMATRERRSSVALLESLLVALRPHPQAMDQAIQEELPRLESFVPEADLTDSIAGMSAEQAAELAADPLFTLGIHTVDHPYLTECDAQEIERQIADNKGWIERLTGKTCDLIAYPLGELNPQVLKSCEKLNLRYGFTVQKRIDGDAQLQLLRVGVYQHSLDELGFKVRWGGLLTRVQSQGYLVTH